VNIPHVVIGHLGLLLLRLVPGPVRLSTSSRHLHCQSLMHAKDLPVGDALCFSLILYTVCAATTYFRHYNRQLLRSFVQFNDNIFECATSF